MLAPPVESLSFNGKCNTFLFFNLKMSDFYSVSKRLLRMTIQNGSAVPARDCSQAGNKTNALRWDLSPDEMRTMTDSLINRMKKVYDDIGSLNLEDVSVENTLKALANAKLDYACKSLKDK